MSKIVDERVVSMQFDNKQFEANVATTMSSVDKLKEKLKFTDAAKGFNNIGNAAKNVNMTGLSSAVEQVHSRFSALEVMGVTALANITNSAVNAGKRMLAALTIDPIKTGFSEYETQLNSVQTILANTSSKGTTLEDVNTALDELNHYADKTIYNFTEMTRNIGTFTAAGVELDTAVSAIQGIANLAAVSGSTSQQASTAMYQLSQALASGTVKLMDWNSVVNAGMGGEVFQNALKETARLHGVAIDEMIEKEGSFRETLKNGWLTSDILTSTLEKFTLSAEEGTEEWEKLKKSLMEKGYTEDQAKEIIKLGNTATDAATKVKTFTQLFDTLKESAQSGWAQTWELIFGDFEEAKEFFSGLSKTLGGFVEGMSNFRNKILGDALTSKWGRFTEKINEAGLTTERFTEKLREVAKSKNISLDDLIKEYGSLQEVIKSGKISTDLIIETLKKFIGVENDASEATGEVVTKLEDMQEIVRKVVRGEFGNGEERVKKLTEAGYEYAKVQEMVNLCWKDGKLDLSKLSDAQLENMGYTDKQIDTLRELAKQAEETGTPIHELIEDLTKPSGRELLLGSITNIIEAIRRPLAAIKDAWNATFSTEDMADGLYKVIEGINKFTEKLIMSEEACENFKKIFEGIFAGIQIAHWGFSASLTTSLKILNAVLGLFDMNLMDLGAKVADWIIKLRDWAKENTFLIGGIDKVAAIIKTIIDSIHKLVDAFLALTPVQEMITKIKTAIGKLWGGMADGMNLIDFEGICNQIAKVIDSITKWIRSLENSKNLGSDIIAGIIEGLKAGIGDVAGWVMNLGQTIIDTFCNLLGIESPSKVFIALGGFIIAGLLVGFMKHKDAVLSFLTNLGTNIFTAVKTVFEKIVNFVKGIDLGAVISVVLSVFIYKLINRIADIAEMFGAIPAGIGAMFEGLGDMFEDFGKAFLKLGKAKAFHERAKGILDIAIAIGILAASVAVLAQIPAKDLWGAVGAVTALSLVVVGLMFALNKMSNIDIKSTTKLVGSAFGILAFTGALALMAVALKKLSTIDPDKILPTLGMLAGVLVGLGYVMKKFGQWIDGQNGAHLAKAGVLILAMSGAMYILTGVIKKIAKIDNADIIRAGIVMAALEILMAGILIVSRVSGGNVLKAGITLMAMSGAFAILIGLMKLISLLTDDELERGISVIAALELLFAGLMVVSRLSGKNAAKAGTMIIATSIALLMMAGAMKSIASIADDGTMAKSLGVIAMLELLMAGLIGVSHFAGANAAKAGLMLVQVAFSLLMLSGVLFILSNLPTEGLGRALGIVTVLSGLFMGLIYVTKNAQDCMKTLIVLTVAIGVLAGALTALTFLAKSNSKEMAIAAASLGGIMVAFATMIAAMQKLPDSSIKSILKTLVPLLLVTVALGGIITAMSFIPNPDTALKTALALSVLLEAFAGAIFIISKSGKMSSTAKKYMAPMLGVAAGLGAILAAMSFLPNPEKAITAAAALSILLEAFSASILILSYTGRMSSTAIKYIGPMLGIAAGLGVIVGLLSFIKNPQGALVSAVALSTLLMAFSGAIVILSWIGPKAAMATAGLQALGILVAATAGVLLVLSGLTKLFPDLNEFLQNGIPILDTLAYAIGSFVGNIIGGLSAGALSGLPEIGEYLSGFMESAAGFLEGLKNFDGDMLKNIGVFTAAMLSMNIAEMVGRFGSVTGFDGVRETVDALTMFVEDMIPLIDSLKGVDADAVTSLKTLAEMLLIVTGADFLSALSSKLGMDGGGLGSFGTQLASFGRSVVEFSKIVTDGGINQEAVAAAAAAGDIMATLQSKLVGTGGVIQFFKGEKNLEEFGNQLVPFGRAIVRFSSVVSQEGSINQQAITAAKVAGETMAALQEAIPNNGLSVVSVFVGQKHLGEFGDQLVQFGLAMVRFSAVLSSAGGIDAKSIGIAKNAGMIMAELQKTIPENGWSMKKFWSGEQNLGEFGNQLVQFGIAMTRFSNILVNNGGIDKTAIDAAANAGSVMAALQEKVPEEGWATRLFGADGTMENFGEGIVKFGEAMVDFSKTVSGNIDTEATKRVVQAAVDMVYVATNLPKKIDLSVLSTGLSDLATAVIDFSEATTGKVDLATVTTVSNVGRVLAETAKIMPDEVDFARITNGLTTFGDAMVDFSASVKEGLDKEAVTNAAGLGKKIVEMVQGIPPGLDLSAFSSKLSELATGIVDFSKAVSGEGAIDTDAINTASAAGSAIAAFVSTIPPVIEATDFVEKLPALSKAIKDFSTSVKEGVDQTAIASATAAGTAISNFLATIPPYVETSGFTDTLSSIATAMVNFQKTFTENAINMQVIENAAGAGKKISSFLESIPPYVDAASFTEDLPAIAQAIERFSLAVTQGVNAEAVTAATNAGKKITDFYKTIPASIDITSFVEGLPKVASSIKEFSTNMADITLPDSTELFSEFARSATNGVNGFITAIERLSSKLTTTGSDMAKSVVEGVERKKPAFTTAGKRLVTVLIKGVNDKKKDAKTAFETLATACKNQLTSETTLNGFISAGKDLTQGFANGISAKKQAAIDASTAVGEACLSAIKAALRSNSPSKETHKLGGYAGDGFVNALYEYTSKSYDAGYSMATSAKDGLRRAINNIGSIIGSDMDTQPTIRPVVDLSEVRASTKDILSMLNLNSSVGIVPNVKAISTVMNRRNQNGTNDDVVDAIGKLRKDLGNVNNTTYSINGITYNSDSDVGEAIETLVRAIRIEGRV